MDPRFGADDEATADAVIAAAHEEDAADELPRFFHVAGLWIKLLVCALAVAALGFATYGVVLVFRYLVGLNW